MNRDDEESPRFFASLRLTGSEGLADDNRMLSDALSLMSLAGRSCILP